MSTDAQQLRAEIEATARKLDLAPSTVGERAGQGGRFYQRLVEGKKVWPDTAHRVRLRLAEMERDASHGGGGGLPQGQPAE